MRLSETDRERIERAVAEAEARTGAEIVVMVAEDVTDPRAWEVTVAAVLALALPGLLLAFETVPALVIWLAQLVLFVALSVLLPVVGAGRRLMGAERRAAAVRAAAEAAFFARGLRNSSRRAAVLIFVALAEREAHVLWDDAAGAVGEGQWRGVAGDLARGMRGGAAVEALCQAARRAGELLAGRFPRSTDDANELPDVIVERRAD